MLDWDNNGRSQKVEALDAATGAVLDTRTVSGFQGGTYLSWDLTGNVRFRFTNLVASSNAVLSGVFFGNTPASTPAPASAAASYVGTDAATHGSWRGAYGGDGYVVAQGTASPPTYAAVTPAGQSGYTWAASTADTRALQKPAPATDRLAAAWYSGTSFTVDVSVGSAARRVSLYMIDWDSSDRSQKVEALDAATGAVLDTRTVSGFKGGTYVTWNLTGNVRFRFTNLNPAANAVLSGAFFDAAV